MIFLQNHDSFHHCLDSGKVLPPPYPPNPSFCQRILTDQTRMLWSFIIHKLLYEKNQFAHQLKPLPHNPAKQTFSYSSRIVRKGARVVAKLKSVKLSLAKSHPKQYSQLRPSIDSVIQHYADLMEKEQSKASQYKLDEKQPLEWEAQILEDYLEVKKMSEIFSWWGELLKLIKGSAAVLLTKKEVQHQNQRRQQESAIKRLGFDPDAISVPKTAASLNRIIANFVKDYQIMVVGQSKLQQGLQFDQLLMKSLKNYRQFLTDFELIRLGLAEKQSDRLTKLPAGRLDLGFSLREFVCKQGMQQQGGSESQPCGEVLKRWLKVLLCNEKQKTFDEITLLVSELAEKLKLLNEVSFQQFQQDFAMFLKLLFCTSRKYLVSVIRSINVLRVVELVITEDYSELVCSDEPRAPPSLDRGDFCSEMKVDHSFVSQMCRQQGFFCKPAFVTHVPESRVHNQRFVKQELSFLVEDSLGRQVICEQVDKDLELVMKNVIALSTSFARPTEEEEHGPDYSFNMFYTANMLLTLESLYMEEKVKLVLELLELQRCLRDNQLRAQLIKTIQLLIVARPKAQSSLKVAQSYEAEITNIIKVSSFLHLLVDVLDSRQSQMLSGASSRLMQLLGKIKGVQGKPLFLEEIIKPFLVFVKELNRFKTFMANLRPLRPLKMSQQLLAQSLLVKEGVQLFVQLKENRLQSFVQPFLWARRAKQVPDVKKSRDRFILMKNRRKLLKCQLKISYLGQLLQNQGPCIFKAYQEFELASWLGQDSIAPAFSEKADLATSLFAQGKVCQLLELSLLSIPLAIQQNKLEFRCIDHRQTPTILQPGLIRTLIGKLIQRKHGTKVKELPLKQYCEFLVQFVRSLEGCLQAVCHQAGIVEFGLKLRQQILSQISAESIQEHKLSQDSNNLLTEYRGSGYLQKLAEKSLFETQTSRRQEDEPKVGGLAWISSYQQSLTLEECCEFKYPFSPETQIGIIRNSVRKLFDGHTRVERERDFLRGLRMLLELNFLMLMFQQQDSLLREIKLLNYRKDQSYLGKLRSKNIGITLGKICQAPIARVRHILAFVKKLDPAKVHFQIFELVQAELYSIFSALLAGFCAQQSNGSQSDLALLGRFFQTKLLANTQEIRTNDKGQLRLSSSAKILEELPPFVKPNDCKPLSDKMRLVLAVFYERPDTFSLNPNFSDLGQIFSKSSLVNILGNLKSGLSKEVRGFIAKQYLWNTQYYEQPIKLNLFKKMQTTEIRSLLLEQATRAVRLNHVPFVKRSESDAVEAVMRVKLRIIKSKKQFESRSRIDAKREQHSLRIIVAAHQLHASFLQDLNAEVRQYQASLVQGIELDRYFRVQGERPREEKEYARDCDLFLKQIAALSTQVLKADRRYARIINAKDFKRITDNFINAVYEDFRSLHQDKVVLRRRMVELLAEKQEMLSQDVRETERLLSLACEKKDNIVECIATEQNEQLQKQQRQTEVQFQQLDKQEIEMMRKVKFELREAMRGQCQESELGKLFSDNFKPDFLKQLHITVQKFLEEQGVNPHNADESDDRLLVLRSFITFRRLYTLQHIELKDELVRQEQEKESRAKLPRDLQEKKEKLEEQVSRLEKEQQKHKNEFSKVQKQNAFLSKELESNVLKAMRKLKSEEKLRSHILAQAREKRQGNERSFRLRRR